MRKNIVLTPEQKIKFDKLIAQSKFNRVSLEILNDKRLSTDSKARQILDLKIKLFGR
jgi:hypothetical protein